MQEKCATLQAVLAFIIVSHVVLHELKLTDRKRNTFMSI